MRRNHLGQLPRHLVAMPRNRRRKPLIWLWRLLTVWMCTAPRTHSAAWPAVQVPLALAAFEREGLVGLDDPGEPVRRLPNRRQRGLALRWIRQNRSNLAALRRRQFIDARNPVPKPRPIPCSAPHGQCKSEPSAVHAPAKCEQSHLSLLKNSVSPFQPAVQKRALGGILSSLLKGLLTTPGAATPRATTCTR